MNEVVDTIKIEKLEGGAFNVVQGNRYSDTLSYDEMLGLVSALTIAKEPNCLRWMQTKEEHETRRPKLDSDITEVEFEDILVPENIAIYTLRDDIMNIGDWGDSLFIGFGSNQTLGYNSINKSYSVSSYKSLKKIQCKLIPCNRQDLKAGDTAFADLLNNNGNILSYCKVIDEREVAHTTPKNGVKISVWNETSLQWYKVVLV